MYHLDAANHGCSAAVSSGVRSLYSFFAASTIVPSSFVTGALSSATTSISSAASAAWSESHCSSSGGGAWLASRRRSSGRPWVRASSRWPITVAVWIALPPSCESAIVSGVSPFWKRSSDTSQFCFFGGAPPLPGFGTFASAHRAGW